MAKKKSKKPTKRRPNRTNHDAQSSGPPRPEPKPIEAKLDETIRMDDDPNVTAEFDPNATVEDDVDATVEIDPNATVEINLDATVEIDPNATIQDANATLKDVSETVVVNDHATIETDTDGTAGVDPNQQTMVDGMTDSTTHIEQPSDSLSGSVSVRRGGRPKSRKNRDSRRSEKVPEDTTVNIGDSTDKTGAAEFSIMASSEIGQTVNPRELSEQDMSDWNSAVGQSDQPTVRDSSVTEESYAEQQFQRLRRSM